MADGVVYVGSRDNFLYAIDTNSGVKKWSFKTGGDIFSSPAVINSVVYIGSDDQSLYAIDKDTGELMWRYKTNSSVGSTPSVVDGVVFVGDNDGFLYAVDAVSGDLKWSTPTMPSYAFSSPSPTVFEDIVCIGSRTHLYIFEKDTGKLGRKRDCMGDYLPTININDCSTPTVVDGVIYLGSSSSLSAYSTKNCKFKWSFDTRGRVYSSPSVVNNVVYFVSGDGFLYAVKTSNDELKWKYYIGRNKSQSPFSSPTVVDGVVYVGSSNNHLFAIDTVTGEEKWRYKMGGSIFSSPAVVDGVVYVGSNDGYLYAVEAESDGQ